MSKKPCCLFYRVSHVWIVQLASAGYDLPLCPVFPTNWVSGAGAASRFPLSLRPAVGLPRRRCRVSQQGPVMSARLSLCDIEIDLGGQVVDIKFKICHQLQLLGGGKKKSIKYTKHRHLLKFSPHLLTTVVYKGCVLEPGRYSDYRCVQCNKRKVGAMGTYKGTV